MALIKLTASELEGVKSQISKMSSKASDCANRAASVRNNLDMEISAKRNIEERLDNIKRDLTKHSESLKSYANVLNDVINEFVKTDMTGSALQTANLMTGLVNGALATAGLSLTMSTPISGGLYDWKTQQKLEKIYETASLCGESSLKKEETGFWGSLWNKGKEFVGAVGDKISNSVDFVADKAKDLYGNVVQAGKDCVSWVGDRIEDAKEWYDENEDEIKAKVKTYGKLGSATIKMVGAAVAIGTGVGVPVAILSVTSAINDLANAHADLVYIDAKQYENVGTTNVLKDYLAETGRQAGSYLGNEEAGEFVGEALYTAINVVTFLDGADKMLTSMGKANTVITGEYGSSSGFFWNVNKTSFEAIENTKLKFSLDTDYFVRKLMGVDPASDANIIYEAGKNIYKSFERAGKLGKNIGELVSNIK